MRLAYLLLITISVSLEAFAFQDTIPEIRIGEVLIHENRMRIQISQQPSPVLILDNTLIAQMPVFSIAELSQLASGVDIRQRGPNGIQADVGIRGSSFDQVLILINGIKLSDPQTGHHTFNLPVDISDIDHIEVYKGSSARVFGQNAFAGAINIITKVPEDKFLRIKSYAGDFGLGGLNLALSFPGRQFKNYLSFNHGRSSGYKYNTDYKISDIFYQNELSTKYGKFGFMGGLITRSFGANGFYSSPEYTEQYEEVVTSLAALTYKPDLRNNKLEVNNRIYWRRNDDEYLFVRSDPAFYRNMHINITTGYDINMTYYNKLGVSAVGADISAAWISSNRLGSRARRNATIFIEHRFNLFEEKMTINPGIQVNLQSEFNSNILPGIDLGYKLNPKLMIFLNSGYTSRVPTFTDLYYEDPGNTPNPQLKPEFAISNEIGFKTLTISGLSSQISCFSRVNNNLIDRSKENPEDKWMPNNIGRVKMKGIDFNLTLYPGVIFNVNRFIVQRLNLSYTYICSEVIGDLPELSRFVFENLKNQVSTSMELKYSARIFHSINLRFADRVAMPAYLVGDTRLGWRSEKFIFFIDITNFTDKKYMETSFVTLPGRWIKAGFSYKMKLQ